MKKGNRDTKAADAETALQELCDKYNGGGFVVGASDEYMSTGSIVFDAVIGQGIPRKKFIGLTSDAGLGKTTCVLDFCRHACSMGDSVLYIDAENGVSDSQLQGIGVTPFKENGLFHLTKASTYAEIERVIDQALLIEKMAYIVIDSITAVLPSKLLEKSVEELEPALKARFLTAFLEKYRTLLNNSTSKASFIFINQVRTKLNFGRTATSVEAGGNAFLFYMDVRLRMYPGKKLERTVHTAAGKTMMQFGAEAKVTAPKNRHGMPSVDALVTVLFGRGISNLAAYKMFLEYRGVLKEKSSGYYELVLPDQEPIKARGWRGVIEIIRDNLPVIKQYVEDQGGFRRMLDGAEADE